MPHPDAERNLDGTAVLVRVPIKQYAEQQFHVNQREQQETAGLPDDKERDEELDMVNNPVDGVVKMGTLHHEVQGEVEEVDEREKEGHVVHRRVEIVRPVYHVVGVDRLYELPLGRFHDLLEFIVYVSHQNIEEHDHQQEYHHQLEHIVEHGDLTA